LLSVAVNGSAPALRDHLSGLFDLLPLCVEVTRIGRDRPVPGEFHPNLKGKAAVGDLGCGAVPDCV
jgi:hypothetical protein